MAGKSASSSTIFTNPTHLGQMYATLLSFALIQKQRHKKPDMFPLLCINPKEFDILMYDTKNDVLAVFNFEHSLQSFVVLWCVLHYKIFMVESLEKYRNYPCNFRTIIKSQGAFEKDPMYLVTRREMMSAVNKTIKMIHTNKLDYYLPPNLK